jgi:protein CpxP
MKMKSLLRTIGVTMTIGTLALSTAAFAQKGKGGEGMHHEMEEGMGKIAKELNLTDAQKAQIKSLREQFKKDNAATLQDIKSLHEQMKQAMKDKNRDQAKSIREQIQAKMQTLQPARQNLMTQIKAVLTPEQRTKLEQSMAERKGDRKEWKEGRKEWKEGRKEHRQGGSQKGQGQGAIR